MSVVVNIINALTDFDQIWYFEHIRGIFLKLKIWEHLSLEKNTKLQLSYKQC